MNKLHVYTGDGKGKTTAAMGLALRSLGHGNPVLIAQFMKRGDSGELIALRKLEGAIVMTAEPIPCFTSRMSEQQREETRKQQTAFAGEVISAVRHGLPAMIILDELGIALTAGIVEASAAQELLETALLAGETIVTGRRVPSWLEEKADYLTRMAAEKHPYAGERLPARKGIEW